MQQSSLSTWCSFRPVLQALLFAGSELPHWRGIMPGGTSCVSLSMSFIADDLRELWVTANANRRRAMVKSGGGLAPGLGWLDGPR